MMHSSKPNFTLLAVIVASLFIAGCSEATKTQRAAERADRNFAAGEYEKAKIDYMNVLRSRGPSAKVYMRLGQIWYDQGAPLRAAPFLGSARELNEGNIENNLRLARVLTSFGQLKQANKVAAAILRQAPDNGEALLLLAQTAHDPEEVAVAEQALGDFPRKETPQFHLATAAIAQSRSDAAAVEQAISNALSTDPKSADAHMANAALRLSHNDTAGAGTELKAAADLAPARSFIRTKYAEYLATIGREKDAIEFLKANVKETPDFLPNWNLLARIALSQKNYADASTYIENVLARDGENLDARVEQAELWLARGETAIAREQLERLDHAYPGAPTIKFQLAHAYLQNNSIPQAVSILEQAVATTPGYGDAVMLLAEIQIRTGNAQAAVAPLERLAAQQPALLRARRLLADAYRGVGRLEKAIELFRQEIKSLPTFAEPYYLLGIALREQKKTAEARAAFEKTAELEPNNPGPVEQLVEMDLAENQPDAAMRRVEQQLQKQPSSAAIHFIRAKVLIAQKQWDAAEAALLKAIELDPKIDVAFRLLVATYISQGKLPEAASRLDLVVASQPKNTSALLTLGMVSSALKDYVKARQTYEKLLAIRPDTVLALNNLAHLYSERFDQLDKAQPVASKARGLAPQDANVADTLGWILYKRGEYEQAMALFRESAPKLLDSPEVQFHYGMASYMMGQIDVARAALERAVNSPDDFAGKDEARRRLAMLAPRQNPATELEHTVKEQPSDVIAWTRLGEHFENERAFDKAAEAYSKALQINPRLVSALQKLADLNLGPLKNSARALELAKTAREVAPNDPDIAALFGKASYQIGNFQQAYSVLQFAARQKSDDPALLHAYAWAAYSVGREGEGVEAMQRAVAISHDEKISADAKTFLALIAAVRTGQVSKGAETQARQVLDRDPNYVPALMVQAAIQSQQGDVVGATAVYNRILERFPDFAPVQKQLATVYAADPANQKKAYELATSARKTLTEDPELAGTLARLSYGRKEYRRVVQLLQESQRQKPLDSAALFYLGMAQVQVNDKSAARETLNKALAHGLSDPAATEAKRALAEIERP